MGKIQLDDKALIGLTAVGSVVYGGHALLAPKSFQDTYYKAGSPYNDEALRWFGLSLGVAGAEAAVVLTGNSITPEGRKTWLKMQAGAFAAGATMMAVNGTKGKHKKGVAYVNAAALATVAGLSLYKGLKKD